MRIFVYYLFFGFWLCLILKNVYWILFFCCFYLLYLSIQYKWKSLIFIPVAIFSLLFIQTSQKEEVLGNYSVYEIHINYVLAHKENTNIVVYGLENVDYYDVIEVVYLDEITSLKNINLFDFQKYMNNQGIYYSTNLDDSSILKKSNSLKSKLYRYLKNNEYIKEYFYDISSDNSVDTIFSSLGFGFISFVYILKNILRKFFEKEQIDSYVLVLLILFGYLFTYTTSLVRLICSELCSVFIKDRHYRLCGTYFLFLMILPVKSSSFVCVFPFFAQFIGLFEKDSFKRNIYTKVLLIGMEFIYFHSINVLPLLLFGSMRKIIGVLCLFSIMSLLISPFSSILSFLQEILQYLPSISFTYVPSYLFIICFFLFFILKKKKTICFILAFLVLFEARCNPFFNVYMINIGQGDCTLLVEPYQKSTILIDCGQNLYRDNVEQIVIPFLESLQIHQLDYVVVTHDDYDHSGGVDELAENFKVCNIITESQENIVEYPFYFLSYEVDSDDENDKSLCTFFSYDSFHYLWTGDASSTVEKALIQNYDLSIVDVFKLGHHGSNTSNCFTFLDTISPKLGLISVGLNNKYGHPSSEVVGNCTDLGINLLETKDVGMIHLFSLPNVLFFETADGHIGIVDSK